MTEREYPRYTISDLDTARQVGFDEGYDSGFSAGFASAREAYEEAR
jgi:hypothetical protein